jgi:hypothetical protein
MYGDRNLLAVAATQDNIYITRLTDILFTKDVLARSLIKDDDSTSAREELDKEKVQLLKQAYMIKYKVKEDQKEEKWKII